MKQMVLLVVCVLFTLTTYSQKELAQVSFNKYEMVEPISDNMVQVGYFKLINGELVRDGIWKLVKNGEVVKKVYYENGKFKWIECKVNGKFTRDQLEIERLKKKVERLEEQIIASRE